MTALSMADHATIFAALKTLADVYPGLPAAELHIRGHVTLAAPLTVEVRFHDKAGDFAAWLAVLRVVEPETRRLEMGGGRFVTQATQHGMGVLFVLTLHHSEREWRPVREAVMAS